ncbi:hypothetical protein [Allorhizocola rhizosphaerae]|uniref:hypothetical protein n=1 Tax=Allorhizocola rhizosphaerae TaxID=1872709 RepID=UPI0013C3206A|nr:hypothetical protein [Allorhizocola rhizosphaerae]
MRRAHINLINDGDRGKAIPLAAANVNAIEASLEELIRRAKLQAGELSLMIQRLEKLRRDIARHLPDGVNTSMRP